MASSKITPLRLGPDGEQDWMLSESHKRGMYIFRPVFSLGYIGREIPLGAWRLNLMCRFESPRDVRMETYKNFA